MKQRTGKQQRKLNKPGSLKRSTKLINLWQDRLKKSKKTQITSNERGDITNDRRGKKKGL